VIPAVEILPVPDKAEYLLGVINLQGRVIPVMNLRKKLGVGEKELALDDKIIILRMMKWTIAIVVDAVEGVIERTEQEVTPSRDITPLFESTEGVVKLDGEMALIFDIDRSLSPEEKSRFETVPAKE